VECDPNGRDADSGRCDRIGVRAYPTWTVGGRRFEGVMTLSDLARASSFPASTDTSTR
jgi:hypothetical protein